MASDFKTIFTKADGGWSAGISMEELLRRGAAHVVDADRAGELQARHPFLYAVAEDLRVADVDALLGAYKQLVRQWHTSPGSHACK